MAVKIESVEKLQKYFLGVAKRADHHAPNIDEIIYSLLGIIILKKDADTDLEVRGNHEDETGNILWMITGGKRIAFRYEHSTGTIEIRRDSYSGPVILVADNKTTIKQILSIL